MITDLLDHEIIVGEYVLFHNMIYQVLALGPSAWPNGSGSGAVKMILLNKAKTTKSVTKRSKEMYMLPKGEVLFWMLKK